MMDDVSGRENDFCIFWFFAGLYICIELNKRFDRLIDGHLMLKCALLRIVIEFETL